MPDQGFFFARHGETQANFERLRSGGDDDSCLTDRGRIQAFRLAEYLARIGDPAPGLIFTAPLARTLATARVLNFSLGLPIRVDSRLRERRLGGWNLRSQDSTDLPFGRVIRPPHGESNPEFKARVMNALADIVAVSERWPLIVSSRGIGRILLESIGQDSVFQIPNGALLRFRLTSSGIPDLQSPECLLGVADRQPNQSLRRRIRKT